MTAITPITTRFHEITPFTTKSDRFYNHPPVAENKAERIPISFFLSDSLEVVDLILIF